MFWGVNSYMRQLNFDGDFFGTGAYSILCPHLMSLNSTKDLLYSVSNAKDLLPVVFWGINSYMRQLNFDGDFFGTGAIFYFVTSPYESELH